MATPRISPQLNERLKAIRLAVFDVDGILTDGALVFAGDQEIKRFHVRDGLGLKQMMLNGVEVALITARKSEMVAQRAKEMGVTRLSMADGDKLKTLKRFAGEMGLEPSQVFYMGDDLVDLAAIEWAGVSATPADGAEDILAAVDWVTVTPGGRGAAREVAEGILKAQGAWEKVLAGYRVSADVAEGKSA
ncbi:MAG: HAD hydrolase family protein [Sumerlaeia bacterium]